MPFTLAHPAAVLPLRRVRLLQIVPLMIGAMTPDVPYYLPWLITKHIPEATHTLIGTFTLDLPIGLFLLLLIRLLRRPLVAPLGPGAKAKCFAALERFGSRPSHWVLAPLSLLVGSWTHIAWDSFTHADGWMVSRISALSAPVSFFSYTSELCHVLQYASSVFGLAVLAVWFHLLPPPKAQAPNGERFAGGRCCSQGCSWRRPRREASKPRSTSCGIPPRGTISSICCSRGPSPGSRCSIPPPGS